MDQGAKTALVLAHPCLVRRLRCPGARAGSGRPVRERSLRSERRKRAGLERGSPASHRPSFDFGRRLRCSRARSRATTWVKSSMAKCRVRSPVARCRVASWRSGAELVVAPLRPLLIGPYSLVSTDGLLAEFKVGAVRPVLERLWPPATSIGSPRFAVYCRPDSSAAELPSSGSLVFEPGQVAVELAPGVDESGLFAERCSHFDSEGALPAGEIWVPPPAMVAGWALSPAVFSSVGLEAVDPVSCQSGELALGLGCARVADDRLTVRTPNAPLLWVVHTARGALVEVSAPGRPLWIDGLPPDTQERLWGTTHDLTGASRSLRARAAHRAGTCPPDLERGVGRCARSRACNRSGWNCSTTGR